MRLASDRPVRASVWPKRLALLCLFIGVLLFHPTLDASPVNAAPMAATPPPVEGVFAPVATPPPGGPEPSAPEYPRGYRPPRANVSHLTESNRESVASLAQALPSRWSWRDNGAVTAVRDQSTCGACYAFAGLGSLESQLLIRGEGAWDFSENNIAECSYEPAGCEGGHIWIVANRLSRYGAVLESCDPYNPADQPCNTGCPPAKIVDGVSILGNNSVPDTSLLKNWLYTYGPLYITIDSGSSSSAWNYEFQTYTGGYTLYYPGVYNLDHAVLLVGWDDALTHAGGQGAWIVKNSWGPYWGNAGYFTIAYGSAGVGTNAAAITSWHTPQPSERLLHLDEAGWQREYGWQSQRSGWGMTRLVPDISGQVSQVELWTTDRTEQVSVAIYDSFNGSSPSGLLRQLPATSFLHAGYYKIAVDPPLAVAAGNDIYVVAHLQNEGYWAAIPIDDLGPAQSGRSYVSANGSAGSWIDLGAQGADVAIRARLGAPVTQATATPTQTRTATRTPTPSTTPTRTATPTRPPTGPTATPRPKTPRLWLPLTLRQRVVVPTVTPTLTRSLTLSVTATHTPGPTVTPGGEWVLVYSHDFQERDGMWGEGLDVGWEVAYDGGQYALTVGLPGWRTLGLSSLSCADCAIEIDGALSGGDYALYGLYLYSPVSEDKYIYRLHSSGMYSFRYEVGTSGAYPIPPTMSPYIMTDYAVNRLRIERLDGTLRLFANGHHLATLTGDEASGGMQIGLTASAGDAAPIQARFDNIRVYTAVAGVGSNPARGDDIGARGGLTPSAVGHTEETGRAEDLGPTDGLRRAE